MAGILRLKVLAGSEGQVLATNRWARLGWTIQPSSYAEQNKTFKTLGVASSLRRQGTWLALVAWPVDGQAGWQARRKATAAATQREPPSK